MSPLDPYRRARDLLEELGQLDAARAVCRKEGAALDQVFTPTRSHPHLARARHALALLLRDELGWSFSAIGLFLGRDHSTIMKNLVGARARASKAAA